MGLLLTPLAAESHTTFPSHLSDASRRGCHFRNEWKNIKNFHALLWHEGHHHQNQKGPS
jgi:hypothetical protein